MGLFRLRDFKSIPFIYVPGMEYVFNVFIYIYIWLTSMVNVWVNIPYMEHLG